MHSRSLHDREVNSLRMPDTSALSNTCTLHSAAATNESVLLLLCVTCVLNNWQTTTTLVLALHLPIYLSRSISAALTSAALTMAIAALTMALTCES